MKKQVQYIGNYANMQPSSDEEQDCSPYPAQQFTGTGWSLGKKKENNQELQFARQTIQNMMQRNEDLAAQSERLKQTIAQLEKEIMRIKKHNLELACQIPPAASSLSEAPREDVCLQKAENGPWKPGMCSFCRNPKFILVEEQFPGHDYPVKSCESCLANFEAYRGCVQ